MRTRRKFTDQQKRKILAEAEAAGQAKPVLIKHKLASSVFARWKRDLAPERVLAKPNGKVKAAKPVSLEAIVYLRHARKAWDAGKSTRGELLARLALDVLEGK